MFLQFVDWQYLITSVAFRFGDLTDIGVSLVLHKQNKCNCTSAHTRTQKPYLTYLCALASYNYCYATYKVFN